MNKPPLQKSSASPPTLLPQSVRHRIFLYLGILITLLAFGAPHGGLIEIPLSFLLKNKLHLEPHELANFRVVSAIPLYLSFVFGFVRDTWNPLGIKDRGFMLLFGSLCSILYVAFALTPVSYAELLVAMVLLTTSFLFVPSALGDAIFEAELVEQLALIPSLPPHHRPAPRHRDQGTESPFGGHLNAFIDSIGPYLSFAG